MDCARRIGKLKPWILCTGKYIFRKDVIMLNENEKTKVLVIKMLKEHRSNVEKYNRIKNDETIKEWQSDYIARKESGGMMASKANRPGSKPGPASIEETLILEQENVLNKIRDIKIKIQFVKLLLMSIEENHVKLLQLRYFENFTVGRVCDALYCSRSTYYRLHDQIINELSEEYERLTGGRTLIN